ncbi:MAG: hypothetical protein PHS62_04800 [Patescibacteria group bacterium]|nr:hypothetical protein [Patescibacteria group bacterium]
MNQKLKNALVILSVYIGSVILALILAPLGGILHNSFWPSQGCWFWSPCDRGSSVEGFIYFYIFLLAVSAFSLLKQKTAWIVYIIGTILFWVGSIIIIATENLKYMRNEDIGSLVIMICMFVIGWLLAQGGLLVYKRMRK